MRLINRLQTWWGRVGEFADNLGKKPELHTLLISYNILLWLSTYAPVEETKVYNAVRHRASWTEYEQVVGELESSGIILRHDQKIYVRSITAIEKRLTEVENMLCLN